MVGAAYPEGSLAGRSFPRARVVMPCRLSWSGSDVFALTRDLSYSGIALSLSDDAELKPGEKAHLHFPNRITLEVIAVHTRHEPARLVAGFKVAAIEGGTDHWKDLIDTVER